MRTVKTCADWDCGLSEYLNPGDAVDEEMADYFLDVLPPVTWTRDMIQMGEAYSHISGKATFHTLYREGSQWVYAGVCHRGQRENLRNA